MRPPGRCASEPPAPARRPRRWPAGSRWMSASSARASARRGDLVGQLRAQRWHARELAVAERAHPRAAQLVDARVAHEPQQPWPGLERYDTGAQGRVHAQEDVLQDVLEVMP